MFKYCAIILTALLMFVSTDNNAQSADEQAISEVINKRHDLINLAKSTPRISELLNLHTSDYVQINTVYTPDGEVSRRESDLSAVKRVLSHYSDAGDVQYETNVDNIAFSQIYERSAVAIYRASYSMNDVLSGNEMYSGTQIITANLKKTPDGWKFRDIYTTELRTNINKYPCGYELYQKDANELLVSVKVPAGSVFKNEYIDIRFNETKPGFFIVQTDRGDEFSWENNVLRSTMSNDDAEIAGRPNSKTGVCEGIIMYYHSDVCSDTRMTK